MGGSQTCEGLAEPFLYFFSFLTLRENSEEEWKTGKEESRTSKKEFFLMERK